MMLFRRLWSGFLLSLCLMQAGTAHADPLSDLINALQLQQLLTSAPVVGTIGASVLDPNGTGDNDFLGADALNPENDLGLTLFASELLGFTNMTGSDTAIPLDALGLGPLLDTLGLTYDAGAATQIRSLLGPDGMVTLTVVDSLNQLTEMLGTGALNMGETPALPGLNNQPLGLAILGEPNSGNATADGLLGLSLLTPGASGNGGLIGLAVLSGDNSGNGSAIGISILGGNNSGNGDNLGVSVLGGDNSGNGGSAGVGVLNGSNSGNGTVAVGALNGANSANSDLFSLAALNDDNSGNSDFATIAAINGDNSGNSGVLSVAAINGDNSGNSDFASVGALNGASSGAGGVITVAVANAPDNDGANNGADGSCAITGGVGCGDQDPLPILASCKDSDGDGVCDENDECADTPQGAPVFLTGCHLAEDAPLVLRGVNFEFDKWDLTPESLPILEHAVKVLEAQPTALVAVDGHTDAKGSFEYNDRLSYRRANTVYSYLIDAGISADRLVYRGFGENVPVASNVHEDGSDNPEGRAENRRVELNILDPESFNAVKEQNTNTP